MTEHSLSATVDKKHGKKAIDLAGRMEILNKRLEIRKNNGSLSLPLVRGLNAEELRTLKREIHSFQLASDLFYKKPDSQKTYMELLADQLPSESVKNIPRALDIIGEIAIIETPQGLEANEKLIGEAILKTHKNVHTVLAKVGSIAGQYRIREYRLIAGEDKTNTIHKEYGCKFTVDIAKAYFSPRLSNEHKRVAALVRENETVVDLFTGVGPFPIIIAKNKPDVKILSIDINPEAIKLLEKNIRINRVEDRVIPILGDARRIIKERFSGVADRVIMNLPERANEFIDVACQALKPSGGLIHYYGFVRLPDTLGDKETLLVREARRNQRKVDSILFEKAVRETAPYEWQFVMDAKIL